MSIGDRIKHCRILLGYSAEQVADRLGVSHATMYRYENGDIAKMPAKYIEPLSLILSTTPAYLMGWSDIGEPSPNLSEDEVNLVNLYRGADDRARADAIEILKKHKRG